MKDKKLLVAKVVGVKGLQGEIKLLSFTDDPLNVCDYELYDEAGSSFFIKKAYVKKTSVLIAKIEGVSSKEQAQVLVSKELFIFRSQLPQINPEEYYHADLIGMCVYNESNEMIGMVINVLNFGSCDILQIDNCGKEFLISFNDNSILEVSQAENSIKIISHMLIAQ